MYIQISLLYIVNIWKIMHANCLIPCSSLGCAPEVCLCCITNDYGHTNLCKWSVSRKFIVLQQVLHWLASMKPASVVLTNDYIHANLFTVNGPYLGKQWKFIVVQQVLHWLASMKPASVAMRLMPMVVHAAVCKLLEQDESQLTVVKKVIEKVNSRAAKVMRAPRLELKKFEVRFWN